MTYRLL